jgi:transcriptional regulator with XRE-family HTH domain
MTKKSLGRQIAIIRQDAGLNQSELAELMGVSVRTVSGWETGDRPPKYGESVLAEIESKLGTSPTKLIANTEAEEEKMYRLKYEQKCEEVIELQKLIIEITTKKEFPAQKKKTN